MFDGMIGRKIGGVLLEELLGHGTMGAVFQARQASLGRRVAVKVLLPELLKNPQAVKRFYREGQALANLKDPHIVQVFDAGQTDDGVYYLIMEFLEGRDLAMILREQGALLPDLALRLLIQASQGLETAHDAGLIHRDIKPSNLMISSKGRLTITDFGLVRQQEGNMMTTQSGQIVGTPAYMSPEQSVTNEVTPSTDLYSLGIVFFEMLTGKPPFWASSALETLVLHISQPLPNPLDFSPSLPADVVAIVKMLAAKKPHQRYPNAREVTKVATAALRKYEASQGKADSSDSFASSPSSAKTETATVWEMASPSLQETEPSSSSWLDAPSLTQPHPVLRTDPQLVVVSGAEHLRSPSNEHSLSLSSSNPLLSGENDDLSEHSLEIPPSDPRSEALLANSKAHRSNRVSIAMKTEVETDLPQKIQEYRKSWADPTEPPPSETVSKTEVIAAIPSPPPPRKSRALVVVLILLASFLGLVLLFLLFSSSFQKPLPPPPPSRLSGAAEQEPAQLALRLPPSLSHCHLREGERSLSPSSPLLYDLQRPAGTLQLLLLCPAPPYAATTLSFSLQAGRRLSYTLPATRGTLFLQSAPPSQIFLPSQTQSLGYSQTELPFLAGKHQLFLHLAPTSSSPPEPLQPPRSPPPSPPSSRSPYSVSVEIEADHYCLVVYRLGDKAELMRTKNDRRER